MNILKSYPINMFYKETIKKNNIKMGAIIIFDNI